MLEAWTAQIKGEGTAFMNQVMESTGQSLSSFAQGKAEQLAARFAPTAEYQTLGQPESVVKPVEPRESVSEKPENVVRDNNRKWLLIGGGLIAVAVIGYAVTRSR